MMLDDLTAEQPAPMSLEDHQPFNPGANVSAFGNTVAIAEHTLDNVAAMCLTMDPMDTNNATKALVRAFLNQLPYIPPGAPANPQLRREVSDLIHSWNVGMSREEVEALTEASCYVGESAFAHTNYEHQRMVSMYSACIIHADDVGHRHLEALGEFVQRFTRGEPQLHPALDCLTKILKTVHQFCTRISADVIVANTLDGVTAAYIEVISQAESISPSATKYPLHLRMRTGYGPAYAHLNFTKSWGDKAGIHYLQLIPEFEFVIIACNDILSFYKETLAGETGNYVHMRAAAEQKPTISVLRSLVEETLESMHKIKELASAQSGLTDICLHFLMGYVEFYFKAGRRYRLHEIIEEL